MRIVYLKIAFALEEDYGSERDHYICKKLIENGHQVSVITSNINYKTSMPKYANQGIKSRYIKRNGIDIYYVYAISNFKAKFIRRIIFYFAYCVSALLALRHIKKADLVYAVSVPLPVGLIGFFYSKLLKTTFYLELTDIWPDVLIEMGALKNKFIIWLLRKMEMFCYRKAEYIITLGKTAKARIVKRVADKSKINVITNGVDSSLFYMGDYNNSIEKIKRQYFLENKYICLYMGAFGKYNALETIIEAAGRLTYDEDIRFVLIGDGDEKAKLMMMVEELNLNNVVFMPPVPRRDSPIYLQVADIFLLPNLKGTFCEMNLQNKLFDYLASAKPIIFAGKGESADIITDSKSGKIIQAENDQDMARAIKEMKALPDSERSKMGKNARNYVLRNYERNKISQRLIHLIENAI